MTKIMMATPKAVAIPPKKDATSNFLPLPLGADVVLGDVGDDVAGDVTVVTLTVVPVVGASVVALGLRVEVDTFCVTVTLCVVTSAVVTLCVLTSVVTDVVTSWTVTVEAVTLWVVTPAVVTSAVLAVLSLPSLTAVLAPIVVPTDAPDDSQRQHVKTSMWRH